MFPDVSAYFGKKSDTTSIDDADALCMYLLQEAKVSTVSGIAFGEKRCIRLSFGVSGASVGGGCSSYTSCA